MSIPAPVHIYTGLLLGVGGVNVLFSRLIGSPEATGDELFLIRYLQGLFLLFSFMFWWVAFLRLRRSRSAFRSTKIISVLMLLIFPWGTAVSLYWFLWVRRFDLATLEGSRYGRTNTVLDQH